MYHNNQHYNKHDYPDMSWAIARQDEALEDLIQSTRQVIKRHTDYMSDNTRYNTPDPIQQQYHHRPSYSKQRSSCSHRNKTHIYPPPPPPPQQHYNRLYTPQSYNHYVEPPSHKKHRHYVPQSPPLPPPPPREYYNKSPEDSFSKTRKWLNRFMPNNYQPPSLYSKQKRIQHPLDIDDDVGLLELKEKIRRTSKPKVPPPSTSRPMIIPAFTKANPEKVIVIDVPLDITVILRSVDQKEAKMYHVTDLSLIEEILEGNAADKPPATTKKGNKKRNRQIISSLSQ
jgi:hypothetical protein